MQSILLVDDSGLFRGIAEKIARRTRCRVLLAVSGADALAVSRRENPDLILLDAEMAGMTGFDVCRVLKADPRFSRVPIVVVSGNPGAAENGRRAGADECLPKPFDEPAVFDTIRKHLLLFPRDESRAAVGWSVTFWRDGAQHSGTLKDLSRGGFFIRTPVRQPIGARLEISFDVPGEKEPCTIVAEALVVRMAQEPETGLGCRFFRVTAASRVHLDECLRMLEGDETLDAPAPVSRDSQERN